MPWSSITAPPWTLQHRAPTARVILGAQPRTYGPELTPGWQLLQCLAGPAAASCVGLAVVSLPLLVARASGLLVLALALSQLVPIGVLDGAQARTAYRALKRSRGQG